MRPKLLISGIKKWVMWEEVDVWDVDVDASVHACIYTHPSSSAAAH